MNMVDLLFKNRTIGIVKVYNTNENNIIIYLLILLKY